MIESEVIPMCDLTEEEQLQPAPPAKTRQLLPYLILAGLFLVGLIVYLCVPIKAQ